MNLILFFFTYLDQLKDGREKKRCKKRKDIRKENNQLIDCNVVFIIIILLTLFAMKKSRKKKKREKKRIFQFFEN